MFTVEVKSTDNNTFSMIVVKHSLGETILAKHWSGGTVHVVEHMHGHLADEFAEVSSFEEAFPKINLAIIRISAMIAEENERKNKSERLFSEIIAFVKPIEEVVE